MLSTSKLLLCVITNVLTTKTCVLSSGKSCSSPMKVSSFGVMDNWLSAEQTEQKNAIRRKIAVVFAAICNSLMPEISCQLFYNIDCMLLLILKLIVFDTVTSLTDCGVHYYHGYVCCCKAVCMRFAWARIAVWKMDLIYTRSR
jgi:hypothetical protein